jgi:arylsulfatase A-like enzyme
MAATPKRVVVVLLDSLNRHMLGCYGGTEFDTPNLDAFAAGAVRFTNHNSGSLPCIPARHDMLCGALDFLWKPWGSIELWEDPITVPLRRAGVVTKLVTDHPHLFEVGGENYHSDFTAWHYERGHESDPWRTRPDSSWIGAPLFGRGHSPYDNSRGWFRGPDDFPGPRTMREAARWLVDEAPAHDNWLLFVDEFDPHEPFDTPEPFNTMYDPDWSESQHLIWPPYAVGAVAQGVITERQGRQVRAQYGAKLTFIDHWFGRLLDALRDSGRLDDTVVIVCTDHGHYLGEKDIWGKPGCPIYEPLGHTPLLISWPGAERGTTCDALTTNVDIHATLLDLFGVAARQRTHGRSLAPLLTGTATTVRDVALAGVYGREVHAIARLDGRIAKYVRGPAARNEPLSMWSNRWSTMPVHALPDLKLPLPDHRARLDYMPGSTIPVIRQPFSADEAQPYWAYSAMTPTLAFDLGEDPGEVRDLAGDRLGREMADMLYAELRAIDAPDDQFARLGYL